MNKLKHTPGPWVVVENDDDTDWVRLPYFYIENKDCDIAEIHDCDHDEDCGHNEYKCAKANARLIAAAPEMLEALIDRCILDNEAGIMHCKSRHAIEKATGQNIKDLLK